MDKEARSKKVWAKEEKRGGVFGTRKTYFEGYVRDPWGQETTTLYPKGGIKKGVIMVKLKEEIFAYLNSLDLADKLLIRDIYYLFCGGVESKQEKAITKILNKRR
ncbi:hypothetical protein ES708_18710 [subsurface metagenome]